MKKYILILSVGLGFIANAQYAPPAGQVGSTAVYKDSSIIINWASDIFEFSRGYIDIADPSLGEATFGDSTQALGQSEGNSADVVSLGDGGSITLTFEHSIKNGLGDDFLVFENSFSDDFLELAFVEVSTDGVKFVRFPSVSLTPETEIGAFGTLDATKLHNLAGKYRQGYGTPFDLEDLIDSSGIDLNDINYVKIIDVVGTSNQQFASFDTQGHSIIDPYPTAFASGGFDLDAVGVVNDNSIVGLKNNDINITIYPNPVTNVLHFKGQIIHQVELYNLRGELVMSEINVNYIDIFDIPNGVYVVKLLTINGVETKKISIKH